MTSWTKEQLSAINEDGKNIIVSAGAGSGKTAVLSERVLRKLKEGININSLLILTFTKAAASEMKERIRKKIKEDKTLKSQLELIDESYITTFDSFALSIVKKYNYLLNLSSSVFIVDDSLISLKKEYILDEIFENRYQKNDKLFEKLIGDFCIKDDEEIKNYILKINSKLDLKYDKVDYLKNYLSVYFDKCKIKNDIDSFISILKNKIEEIENILEELYFLVDNSYYCKLKDALNPLFNANNYQDILQNISVSLPNLPRGSSDEVKDLKSRISNILTDLNKMCKYKDEEEIFNQIMETYDYVKCIIDIILELNEKIYNYKFENDMFEFNDIAAFAINLLKENNTLREEVKNSFSEIMIDEYQDTNDLQEEFISLISNDNVYMVGDIKQSIYRFRNANPYIFKNKYDSYKNNNGGFKIDLNKNFRSRKEVLNNINMIFDTIMDNLIGGAKYKDSHQMIFGNISYDEKGSLNQNSNLEIYNYEYDNSSLFSKEEIEAFIIANDIKNKISSNYKVYDKDDMIVRKANYNDFVILMDKSTNFELYKKIFEYNGIPLTIYKDEKITDDMILYVLKNLILLILKIYDNSDDDYFKYLFSSISRSFLIEMQDDELFLYFKNNNFNDSDLYKKCKKISEKIDYMSINDFVKCIIDEFNFYDNIIKIGNVYSNIVKLDYILNMTNDFSNMGYTISDFANHLDEIVNKDYDIKFNANKENSNSVRIMTIHKSKGLEYHICYYPGLYSKFNIKELNDKFIFDDKYGIVSSSFNEGIDQTIYKELLKDNYIKEEISEKIRLLYVGLTRAKEKMILICDLDKEKEFTKKEDGVIKDSYRMKYRSFKDIILSVKKILNNNITNINVNSLNISKDYMLIKNTNYLDYIDNSNEKININKLNIYSYDIDSKSFSKKQNSLLNNKEKENINLGLDMHYLLETIDFINPKLDNLDEFYKSKVNNFLNNDIFNNINKAKIYKEYEFMYEDDKNIFHGIIDLMLVYDDHVDIIDYKLKNIIDENYKKQLNGYKTYIKNKLNKKTNTYLYSILENKLIKI